MINDITKKGVTPLKGVRNSDLYDTDNAFDREGGLEYLEDWKQREKIAHQGYLESSEGHMGYDALNSESSYNPISDPNIDFKEEEGMMIAPTQEKIEDLQAARQGWLEKAAFGLGKTAVTFGTTALGGTVGFVYGAAAAIGKGEANAFWNNDFNKAMTAITNAAEEAMPHYKTAEEKHGGILDSMLTVNFLTNDLLTTAGFIYGSAVTGRLAAGMTSKIFQVVNATKNITKANQITSAFIGSGLSAIGEASIEATHTTEALKKIEGQKLEDIISVATNDYLAKFGGNLDSPEAIQEWTKLKAKEVKAKQELEEKIEDAGNTTLALNSAILIAPNYFNFARYYTGGMKTARRAEKVAGNLKDGFRNKMTNTKKFLTAAAVPISEGAEEMTQGFISSFASNKNELDFQEYFKSRVDYDAGLRSRSTVASLAEAFNETLTEKDSWMQGIAGFIMGGTGTVSVGKDSNKEAWIGKNKPVGMSGGFFGKLQEYKKEMVETEAKIQKANTAVDDVVTKPGFATQLAGLTSNIYFQDLMDKAALEGNQFDYKNAEFGQLFGAIAALDNIGKIQELKGFIEANHDTSDANLEAIIENTTSKIQQEDGTFKYTGPFVDEKGNSILATTDGKEKMIASLEENKNKTLKEIDNYVKIKQELDQNTYNSLTDTQLEELTFLKLRSLDSDERANELFNSVSNNFKDLNTKSGAVAIAKTEAQNKQKEVEGLAASTQKNKTDLETKKESITSNVDFLANTEVNRLEGLLEKAEAELTAETKDINKKRAKKKEVTKIKKALETVKKNIDKDNKKLAIIEQKLRKETEVEKQQKEALNKAKEILDTITMLEHSLESKENMLKLLKNREEYIKFFSSVFEIYGEENSDTLISIIESINDIIKLSNNKSAFIKKLIEYLESPETLDADMQKARRESFKKAQELAVNTVVDKVMTIDNKQEQLKELNKADPEIVDYIIEKLNSTNDPKLIKLAKDYQELLKARVIIFEMPEAKNPIVNEALLTLFEDSTSVEELLENFSGYIASLKGALIDENEKGNSLESEGIESQTQDTISFLETIVDKYNKAIEDKIATENDTKKPERELVNTTADDEKDTTKSNSVFQATSSPGGDIGDTNKDENEDYPIDDLITENDEEELLIAKILKMLEGKSEEELIAIANGNVEFKNTDIDSAIIQQVAIQKLEDLKLAAIGLKEGNTKESIGSNYISVTDLDTSAVAQDENAFNSEFLDSSSTTQYDINGTKARSLVYRGETNKVVTTLEALGVYSNVDNGYLSVLLASNPNLKIHYIKSKDKILDKKILLAVELPKDYKGGGIITIIDDRKFLMVGTLKYSITEKNKDAGKSYNAIVNGFNNSDNHSIDNDAYTVVNYTNNVKTLYGGRLATYTTSNTNEDDINKEKDITENFLEGSPLELAIHNGKILIHSESVPADKVVPLDGGIDRKGSIWMLVKGADGKYYPTGVKIKTLKEKIDENKESNVINNIQNLLNILANPNETYENQLAAKFELKSILYFPSDQDIFFNTNNIRIKDGINSIEIDLNNPNSTDVILNTLINLGLRFRIMASKLNDPNYIQELIKEQILTTNLIAPKMYNSNFSLYNIDVNTLEPIIPKNVNTKLDIPKAATIVTTESYEEAQIGKIVYKIYTDKVTYMVNNDIETVTDPRQIATIKFAHKIQKGLINPEKGTTIYKGTYPDGTNFYYSKEGKILDIKEAENIINIAIEKEKQKTKNKAIMSKKSKKPNDVTTKEEKKQEPKNIITTNDTTIDAVTQKLSNSTNIDFDTRKMLTTTEYVFKMMELGYEKVEDLEVALNKVGINLENIKTKDDLDSAFHKLINCS